MFTTHTPVPAGHDVFTEEMIRAYLSEYPTLFNIQWEKFVGLGRVDENDTHEKYSMSHLAAHVAQEINGVSEIHGRVSQDMFQHLWPGFMPNELHVSYVTNGVHYQTWTARQWQMLFQEMFASNTPFRQIDDQKKQAILKMPELSIWNIRKELKRELVKVMHDKIRADMTRRHENPKEIIEVSDSLREDVLVIGFARRFATYKRAALLFSDKERLLKLLHASERPLQFVFAGKAHPQDRGGKDLIREIYQISKSSEFAGRVVFIEDYDMRIACLLYTSPSPRDRTRSRMPSFV